MIEKETLKARLIRNMRYIIDHSTLKIGGVEREAGVSLGYLSRKEADIDNPLSDGVSIHFTQVFASKVGIPIDVLVSCEIPVEMDKIRGARGVWRDTVKLISNLSDIIDRAKNSHAIEDLNSAINLLSSASRALEHDISLETSCTSLSNDVAKHLLEILIL